MVVRIVAPPLWSLNSNSPSFYREGKIYACAARRVRLENPRLIFAFTYSRSKEKDASVFRRFQAQKLTKYYKLLIFQIKL